jgi:hypothetical protein
MNALTFLVSSFIIFRLRAGLIISDKERSEIGLLASGRRGYCIFASHGEERNNFLGSNHERRIALAPEASQTPCPDDNRNHLLYRSYGDRVSRLLRGMLYTQ